MQPSVGRIAATTLTTVLTVVGCTVGTVGGTVALAPPAAAATATPTSLLAQLRVEPESNSPAYDRERFEEGIDADGDGCNTRREVLIAESTVPVSIGSSCSLRGSWTSYYDGVVVTDIAGLEVDHAVALAQAWRSGARSWNDDQRRAFANDEYGPTLVAVTPGSNQAKRDKDFAQWRPPAGGAATCRFAVEQVLVKYRWDLSVDVAERDALAGVLPGCGNGPVEVPTRAVTSGGGGGGGGGWSTVGSQLAPGQSLTGGQWLMAPNGRYGLAFQADGNLVAYGPDYRPLFHSGTFGNPGARLVMQADGNLVVYAADGRALWHTYTWGNSGSTLRMQNDGNAVLYRGNGRAAWYSGWDVGQRATSPSGGTRL